MANVGDVLTDGDGQRIRLTGVLNNGTFVAEPADAFGAPFRVSTRELAADYGISDPSPPSEDFHDELRARDQAVTEEVTRAYAQAHPAARAARRRARQLAEAGVEEAGPPPGSPEAYFADVSADT